MPGRRDILDVYVRLVGASLSQTSLYVHKAFISVALPPEDSEHWRMLTGASLQKKPATHYLLVRDKQLADPKAHLQAKAAAVTSVAYYRDIYIGEPGRPGAGEAYTATCPDCFAKLSVTGKCFCSDD